MKIIALDIGDRWTGIAISDPTGIIARPLTTVATADLEDYLSRLILDESVTCIVAGYPKTLRGTESEQTRKTIQRVQDLQKKFTHVTWELWDERLTSKQAAQIKQARTKEEKLASHARAAALILSSYLEYKRLHR